MTERLDRLNRVKTGLESRIEGDVPPHDFQHEISQRATQGARSVAAITMASMMLGPNANPAFKLPAGVFIAQTVAMGAIAPLAYALAGTRPIPKEGERIVRSLKREDVLFACLWIAFTESGTAEGGRAMENEMHETAQMPSDKFPEDTGMARAHAAFEKITGHKYKSTMDLATQPVGI